MRETKIRIVAEWQPIDLQRVNSLVETGALSLKGLITHTSLANDAEAAYPVAFNDPDCLKMILDWRS
jgi:3-hydroxyethyl bacteriochlorophyllide a dehydrogenase